MSCFFESFELVQSKLNVNELVIDFSISPSLVYSMKLDYGLEVVLELFCDDDQHVSYSIYKDGKYSKSGSGSIQETLNSISTFKKNLGTKLKFDVSGTSIS